MMSRSLRGCFMCCIVGTDIKTDGFSLETSRIIVNLMDVSSQLQLLTFCCLCQHDICA